MDFTCTIVYPEGAQSNPFDIALSVGENATVTVPAGAQYWVEVALPAQQVEYVLNITGTTGFAFTQGWMQNNDVDGVYTADPRKDASATKIDEITYQEILSRGLAAMDSTATSFCMDNHIPILVFGLDDPDNIYRAVMGEEIGTIVK